jgi:hypothetical protein
MVPGPYPGDMRLDIDYANLSPSDAVDKLSDYLGFRCDGGHWWPAPSPDIGMEGSWGHGGGIDSVFSH